MAYGTADIARTDGAPGGAAGTRAAANPRGPAAAAGAPPFLLSVSHFAAALAFFAAGSLGLIVNAGDLAAGRFLAPGVVATAHLFTLGWLTTSIMGALYQLFPVVLGVRARSERLGFVTIALYAPGLAAFLTGLAVGASWLMLAGVAAFGTALVTFCANAGVTLRRARTRDVTWWSIAGGLAFLLITVVLGASLAGNLRWSHLGTHRLLALGVHMHVALGGFVLLIVIGVSRRLLPMFLLSHGDAGRWGGAAALLAGAGAGTLSLLHRSTDPRVWWIAATLLAAAVAAFLIQAIGYVRRAKRPKLDAGLRLAVTGIVLLPVATTMGILGLAFGFSTRLATAYGLLLVVGSFGLMVAGHYYKILPFLVWNERIAPLVRAGRPLPRVADLYDERLASRAAWLLPAGVVTLAAGALLGAGHLALAGACAFAAGAFTVVLQMMGVLRTRTE